MRVAMIGGGSAFAELVALELDEAGFDVERVRRAAVLDDVGAALVAGSTASKDAPHLVRSLRRLRADLPVVMLTGSREAERRGYAQGADVVLLKPFEFSELVAILKRLAGRLATST